MIKYYCDVCENEVDCTMVLHICEDCVIKINDFVIYGIKNKPRDTNVSGK